MKTTKFVFILSLALGFSACQKEEDNQSSWNLDDAAAYAEEQVSMETVDGDLQLLADQAESGDLSSFKTGSSCATISRDTTSNPHKIIIDFGTVNCMGPDSNYRRGQIIISLFGRRGAGPLYSQRILETQQYFFNDQEVDAYLTLMRNPNFGSPKFTRSGRGSMVSVNKQDTLRWSINRSYEFVQGFNTPLIFMDNAWQITGTSNLASSGGRVRNTSISSPLLRKAGCRWISEGVMQITNASGQSASMDFGNGSCDRWATLSINGNSRTIRLR